VLRGAIWYLYRLAGADCVIATSWLGGSRIEQTLPSDISRCAFVTGCYEPNEMSLLSKLLNTGDTVVDIGANEGLYSLYASTIVGPAGRVVAVEPSPREVDRLRRNISLSRFGNINVHELAITDVEGAAELHLTDPRHAGQNTLGEPVYEETRVVQTVEVRTRTLDSFVESEALDRLDLLKIDVEGAEMSVLRGGESTLNRLRPVVLLELQDSTLRRQGSSASELTAHLGERDYELCAFSVHSGLLDRQASVAPGSGVNVVAIPREKATAVLRAAGS